MFLLLLYSAAGLAAAAAYINIYIFIKMKNLFFSKQRVRVYNIKIKNNIYSVGGSGYTKSYDSALYFMQIFILFVNPNIEL